MYVIGNGSNILVKDNGIRGIVLSIEFDNIEIKENEVIAGAGVKLIALSYKCAKCGLTGLEFASGIPGTIGGAVRMNAGAYGNEMSNIIVETLYMDMEGNIHTISNQEHDFSYRKSFFTKNKNIILQTKLKLEKGDEIEIKSKMDELKKSRDEKQPLEFFSAGSTFKRGEDFITSKLIDEAGLKGYRVGDAEVSTKHAGFIINKGNAKAKDILDVIEYVKTKVKEKFGKDIELEIEIIGEN
jgi:UDP-N-acetylmuramate dehydrogenase